MSVDGRPSHVHLMAATDALSRAREAEQAAGNELVSQLINQLTIAVFKVALQSDLDEWLATQAGEPS